MSLSRVLWVHAMSRSGVCGWVVLSADHVPVVPWCASLFRFFAQFLDWMFQGAAVRANQWENHATESAYRNNLVWKVREWVHMCVGMAMCRATAPAGVPVLAVLPRPDRLTDCFRGMQVFPFRLFNSFVSLFYYAFSERHSILVLSVQLASFVIGSQIWNNVVNVVLPCLCRETCGQEDPSMACQAWRPSQPTRESRWRLDVDSM